MRKRALLLLPIALVTFPRAHGNAQGTVSERPSVTVSTFEFGTVASQLMGDERTRRGMERVGVRDGNAFVAALGTGVADLVVEQLVESARFRVYERRQLDAVRGEQRLGGGEKGDIPSARYIITGSITHLGLNDKEVGGIAAGIATRALFGGLGALSAKSSSTTLRLTARVVDTHTGEIVGSFTADGVSNKRWGLKAFGLGNGGFGGAQILDQNFRESAIGEAATRAAAAIVERVIALRATRLGP